MKDILTFYRCDPPILEEKILSRDMIEGTELAGQLERFGEHLGMLRFEQVLIGDIFEAVEAVTGSSMHLLMGRGERRIEPAGPITYCGRHHPVQLGDFTQALGDVIRLRAKKNPEGPERARQNQWRELAEKIGLDKGDPGALERLRRFIDRFRNVKPEVISVYERW